MKSLNSQSLNYEYQDEDEIDIREIFSVLSKYKKSIILITLIATIIAASRAYFSPSIYQAHSLLKVSRKVHNYGGLINTAMYPELSDAENELIVFKSYTVASRVLETLNIGTRYYTKNNFRTVELYKNSPFVVIYEFIAPELYGVSIKLIPISNTEFRLQIEAPYGIKLIDKFKTYFSPSNDENHYIEYDKIHSFSETIKTEWFVLSIQKISQLDSQPYSFTIVPNSAMSDFVQNGISASTATKLGNMVTLSFSDTVPLRAKEIVNAVARAYIDENLAYESKSSHNQLAFIDRQLNAIDKALKSSSEKLQKYKATNIVVDLDSKANMTAVRLSQLETKLYEINMQVDIMESILNHIEVQKDISSINMDYSQNSNPAINSLLQEMQREIASYATLSANFTQEHPGIIAVKRKILSLKRSLKEALNSNLKTLKDRKIRLLSIIDKERGTMRSFPEQEQKLGQLTRHFMVNEKVYSFLLEKRAETAIEQSSTVSNTRIIDYARIPNFPIKPKRLLIVLVGFILGFILGVAQAFLRAFLDNSIKTSEDIEKLTQVPLYGIIPLQKTKKMIPYYQEAIRSLWINLAFMKTKNNSKLISITSAVSGEGKSFTLYHLSRMIAKNGDKSVIVLDLDMRRASLHKYFDLDNTKGGMSSLLADRCTLDEAILATEYDNLNVITSGPKTSNPTGLIMSLVLESIIDKLSQKYDYIFLDTPPIGLVSDATKIMYLSDITLFILKADSSTKEFIKEINHLNEKEEVNMGIVLNGVDYGKKYGIGYKSDYMDGYLTKE